MATVISDRIENRVVLNAPPDAVWNVLTDPAQFGSLFSVKLLASAFRPGIQVSGIVTHRPLAGTRFEFVIERMERERVFSWRWHPFAVADVDYSAEPMTLVAFKFQPATVGTRLTLTESGFERLPPQRRGPAFRANRDGWSEVLRKLGRVVEKGRLPPSDARPARRSRSR